MSENELKATIKASLKHGLNILNPDHADFIESLTGLVAEKVESEIQSLKGEIERLQGENERLKKCQKCSGDGRLYHPITRLSIPCDSCGGEGRNYHVDEISELIIENTRLKELPNEILKELGEKKFQYSHLATPDVVWWSDVEQIFSKLEGKGEKE